MIVLYVYSNCCYGMTFLCELHIHSNILSIEHGRNYIGGMQCEVNTNDLYSLDNIVPLLLLPLSGWECWVGLLRSSKGR